VEPRREEIERAGKRRVDVHVAVEHLAVADRVGELQHVALVEEEMLRS
jgi:hypothetical protein